MKKYAKIGASKWKCCCEGSWRIDKVTSCSCQRNKNIRDFSIRAFENGDRIADAVFHVERYSSEVKPAWNAMENELIRKHLIKMSRSVVYKALLKKFYELKHLDSDTIQKRYYDTVITKLSNNTYNAVTYRRVHPTTIRRDDYISTPTNGTWGALERFDAFSYTIRRAGDGNSIIEIKSITTLGHGVRRKTCCEKVTKTTALKVAGNVI